MICAFKRVLVRVINANAILDFTCYLWKYYTTWSNFGALKRSKLERFKVLKIASNRSKALQIGALQSAKNRSKALQIAQKRFKSLKSAPIWSAFERFGAIFSTLKRSNLERFRAPKFDQVGSRIRSPKIASSNFLCHLGEISKLQYVYALILCICFKKERFFLRLIFSNELNRFFRFLS